MSVFIRFNLFTTCDCGHTVPYQVISRQSPKSKTSVGALIEFFTVNTKLAVLASKDLTTAKNVTPSEARPDATECCGLFPLLDSDSDLDSDMGYCTMQDISIVQIQTLIP